ncbi:MAG: polysaccharide deacetylase family protein [Candidatus Methylomirabilia bacterium]
MTISNLLRRTGCAPAILAAALAGCATTSAVAPPPVESPAAAPRQAGGPTPLVQTPEFVAVVVRPGETLASLAAAWLRDQARAWEIADYNGIADVVPGQELVIPLRPFRRGGLTPERYQTVPVLVYHQFAEKSTNRMTVSREAFAAQMEFLKVKGYRVVPLEHLVDFVDFRGQLPEKSVVITIDDGWRSTYDIAFPILKKYGYPATLFVYTQLVNGSGKTLSWDQVREMSAQGLDVQCHTISHRNLALPQAQESADQYFTTIAREITESARTIEQKLGKRPTILAYPYGDTNGLAIALLKGQGYRAALTVAREANPFFAATYRLGRSMIYGDFDLARFEKNLVTSDRKALR